MLIEERHKKILGEGFEHSFNPSIWSVRVNTLKTSVKGIRSRLEEKGHEIEQMPWVKEGFWVNTNEILSRSLEHMLGYFFLQNSSSMIPPLVLNPLKDDAVLDMCAAPGSKTTQIAAMMENEGSIIANDISRERLKALRGNLQRCGVMNTIVTKYFAESFYKTGLRFNKILLDVPCTGTGSMNPRVLKETNIGSIRFLSKLQKKLLISASKCLDEDGALIYSTCSLEPEENEENIDFAVKELDMTTEKIELDFPKREALLEWNGKIFDDSVNNAIRIIPSEKMEGFFICKLRV